MGPIVSFQSEFSDMGLRRAQDVRLGQLGLGNWEGDRFKLSHRVDTGWTLAMWLKPIGESAYWGLASAEQDGIWTDVGVLGSQTAAIRAARGFLDGDKVWREAYRTNLGNVPAAIIDSKAAHAELARGDAPRGSHT